MNLIAGHLYILNGEKLIFGSVKTANNDWVGFMAKGDEVKEGWSESAIEQSRINFEAQTGLKPTFSGISWNPKMALLYFDSK